MNVKELQKLYKAKGKDMIMVAANKINWLTSNTMLSVPNTNSSCRLANPSFNWTWLYWEIDKLSYSHNISFRSTFCSFPPMGFLYFVVFFHLFFSAPSSSPTLLLKASSIRAPHSAPFSLRIVLWRSHLLLWHQLSSIGNKFFSFHS